MVQHGGDYMITQINCICGNKDPRKAVAYDGCLGYEAIICSCCGRYSDYNGLHEADEWSKEQIQWAKDDCTEFTGRA